MEFADEPKVPETASSKRQDSYTLSIERLLTHTAVHPNDSDYDSARNILDARNLREKYAEKLSAETEKAPIHYKWNDDFGIFEFNLQDDVGASGEFSERDDNTTPSACIRGILDVPTIQNFVDDYHRICEIAHDKVTNSFCHHTLRTIQHLADVHIHMHWRREEEEIQNSRNDFFSITKVDTHVHLSAAFSPLDLLQYMKKQITHYSDEIAYNGRTLTEICKQVDISAENLTLGKLGIQANEATFSRFDIFNSKFTLAGSVGLREAFLGYKMLQKDREGRDKRGFHLAELTKKAHERLIEDGHVFAEWRISVTGSSASEWDILADFMIDNGLHLLEHNKWMVQNPRLYGMMKKRGLVQNYGQVLQNFFGRLFEATLYPERHSKLAQFLAVLSGFDSVDDESVIDPHLDNTPPRAWTSDKNPHYAYQLYFFWANIKILNRLRRAKGLNVFSFRPHCGESGDKMHLAVGYLLSDGIAHGINLEHNSTLQYLYFLDQIGIAVSPSSNNFLFLKIDKSPFLKFLKRGLNVSLSTDDPTVFHVSSHPLLEEYSICRIHWSLTNTDLSEIARNSVIQSGFSDEWKQRHLDLAFVPSIRLAFREQILNHERDFIWMMGSARSSCKQAASNNI